MLVTFCVNSRRFKIFSQFHFCRSIFRDCKSTKKRVRREEVCLGEDWHAEGQRAQGRFLILFFIIHVNISRSKQLSILKKLLFILYFKKVNKTNEAINSIQRFFIIT